MAASPEQSLRAWVDYLRDMGIYDLYRREPDVGRVLSADVLARLNSLRTAEKTAPALPRADRATEQRVGSPTVTDRSRAASQPGRALTGAPPAVRPASQTAARTPVGPPGIPGPASPPLEPLQGPSYFTSESEASPRLPPELAAPMPKPNPLEALFAPPATPVPAAEKAAALERLRNEIGDCTRCPLAYAGRHTIVFGEGDPNAELMFIGEGPGADEDETGRPFVGKAGQLLNNMIVAMGLQREQVFIGNVVKCRPPKNRAPEFVEATTCSQFLLGQIDIVQPKVIVALGSTAATYVLGVRQTLTSLRGQWFAARGAKVAVTFHPAFLLRDPRQKAEAWKDLQRVMAELGLKAAARQG